MAENLPIVAYKNQIIETVAKNKITIIRAETGAGKSIKVPQYLASTEERVVITQPRRIAALSLAQRVAQEVNCAVGEYVGYRTAVDRMDGPDTRILFCTDGLELVVQVMGGETPQGVIVIDEIHEWNLNIEMLVAWCRREIARGASYKLVLMSATIDIEPLQKFLQGAAVIDVPGRSFPITEQRPHGSIVQEAASLIRSGRNVLVFQPGKAQIKHTIEDLEKMQLDAEIFPLHADLVPMDQIPCFLEYKRPKCVVCTNIAQTSLTIPDIDAVVDSGIERRAEYANGVRGLYLRPISLADREQRKGRAGRTKPGIYVDMCTTELGERISFPKPDVLRLPIEKVAAQLALVGIDIENLRFLHQPDAEQIRKAKETLFAIGCMDGEGNLTEVGKEVATLPLAPRLARMLIEAKNWKVLHDMIKIAAVMEQGGVTRDPTAAKRTGGAAIWSDAFTQLEAFKRGLKLEESELEENGIEPLPFAKAKEAWTRLNKIFKRPKNLEPRNRTQRILRCLYTGLGDYLYKKSLVKGFKDSHGKYRNLPEGSPIASAHLVVGLPWNLQINGPLGPRTLRLITMATKVDPLLFLRSVPHLVQGKPNGKITEYSHRDGTFLCQKLNK